MRTRAIVLLLTLLLSATALSGAATAQQNIVGGELTDVSLQRRLGLVFIGGCSGTLLNRFWVLTAEHCIVQGPNKDPAPFTSMRVTADWSDRIVTPTRYVRYRDPAGVDVALVFLGAGDFGPVEEQTLYREQLPIGTRVTKYGAGIYAFATRAGSPPIDMAARGDGRYRHAEFYVSASDGQFYTLPTNSAGQTANGGDSGGADIVTGDDGAALGISGVSSNCTISSCLPGRTCVNDFRWVTGIRHCQSAPIFSIRNLIRATAQEGLRACRFDVAACTVSEMTHLLLLQ